MTRSADLARFIDAFEAATRAVRAGTAPSKTAAARMCAALAARAGETGNGPSHSLAVCNHLAAALANTRAAAPPLAELADALQALAPLLAWSRSDRAGGDMFDRGHANTQFVGPAGLERRSDVVLGASLLAPGVVYPNHDHPPEEIYLVMSEGEWFSAQTGWYAPGIGGIVHHRPGVTHAMRAGPAPLLALWCLWPGR